MRFAMALVLSLLLFGCGGGGAGDKRAQTATDTQAGAPRPAEAPRPPDAPRSPEVPRPPNPRRSVPTRLLGGPLVFRVVGARTPTAGNRTPQLRYAMIFRLNRPHPRHDLDDPPLPPGARDVIGNVSLANLRYDWEYSIFNFDADGPDRDNCFVGYVRTDVPGTVRALDRVPDLGRVRVRLRLLTPRSRRTFAYGPLYLRRPRLLAMRVEPFGPHDKVTSVAAYRELQRIGCSATVL